jgi:hypothetical protein
VGDFCLQPVSAHRESNKLGRRRRFPDSGIPKKFKLEAIEKWRSGNLLNVLIF